MNDLYGVLVFVLSGLSSNDDRFVIHDTQHFTDQSNGVKWHLYKDDFHLSDKDGNIIIHSDSFDDHEKKMVWQIKYKLAQLGAPSARQLLLGHYQGLVTPAPASTFHTTAETYGDAGMTQLNPTS